MTDLKNNRRWIYVRWFLLRFGLVVYDIMAVNVAYYLALIVRFYVNFEFNVWAVKYVPAFFRFAPYYTLCCLIVFAVFGLYNSLWKYASMREMHRIITVSVITCLIHIVGTLMFVVRMPITYYVFGAAFQFVLITISRFSYRFVLIERGHFFKQRHRDAINVMVVGVDETSRTVIKHLERDPSSVARPVCAIDIQNSEFRGTMAGIPVVGGISRIKDAVAKYKVDRILLADSIVTPELRREVREIGKEIDVSVQDFSGYFQSTPSRVPLRILLEYVDGPVEIKIGNEIYTYQTAEMAAAEISGKYIVSSVLAKDGILCITLIHDVLRPNDTQAEWVQAYRKETGEDISFF